MKALCLAIGIAFFMFPASAQNVTRINISGSGNTEAFIISLDDYVKLYIGKDGNISKWGYDRFEARGQENYQDILDPYVGRVDYYGQNDDEAYRGKMKYIGRIAISYYASYENESLRGKIKSIGSNSFDYYLSYEDESFRGNIKSIGQQSVTWYSAFDNEGLRGKLKSIGNTQLSYYSSFEDKAYHGKLKSIDGYDYTYYSSFEKYSGSMKTGASMQQVSAIRFYIKNF